MLDERRARFVRGLGAAQRLAAQPGIQAPGFGRGAVDVAGRTGSHAADPALQSPQQLELDQASQLPPCPASPRDRLGDAIEAQPLQLPGAQEAQPHHLLHERTVTVRQPLVEGLEPSAAAGHD